MMPVDLTAMAIDADRSSLGSEVFSLRPKRLGVRTRGKQIVADGIDAVLDLIRIRAEGRELRAREWEFDNPRLEFYGFE